MDRNISKSIHSKSNVFFLILYPYPKFPNLLHTVPKWLVKIRIVKTEAAKERGSSLNGISLTKLQKSTKAKKPHKSNTLNIIRTQRSPNLNRKVNTQFWKRYLFSCSFKPLQTAKMGVG